MAFKQEYIDRFKASGFYKHVEWVRKNGILIKLYSPFDETSKQLVSFETGSFDEGYDQKLDTCRQFFLSRKEAVQFMLNLEFPIEKITRIFRKIDGKQIIEEWV